MTLNLYGHTHQNTNFYEDRPYMYHVGVDSHDGYPVLLDTVIIQMKNKVDECKGFLGNEDTDEMHSSKQPNIETVIQSVVNNWPNWKKGIYKKCLENAPVANESRCYKCVFENTNCGSSDIWGTCPIYTRDPPDGGFYG